MYANNQLLFPHSLIPYLRDVRGPEWAALIDHIQQVPEGHEDSLAFVLTMIRLNGCLSCETDSYRAMRGCDACAIQTLRRFKGTDAELINTYRQSLDEVRHHLIASGRLVAAQS